MDPGTALIVASLISAGAQAGAGALGGRREKKLSKARAKESKRETMADLLNSAFNREAENEVQRLDSRGRLGRRRSQSAMDTANLVREAFTI